MEQVNNIFKVVNDGNYEISLKDFSEFLDVEINEKVTCIIDLKDIKGTTTITFNLARNANCKLRFLLVNEEKNITFKSNLFANSTLNVYFADYSTGKTTLKSIVNLNEEKSNTSFKFTSLTKKNDVKKYDISFNHIVGKTYSNFEGYGVAMDKSFLTINGVSHVYANSTKSEAHQKVKVILFDELSRAIANPILKIDNDDIIASHACAIGSLNNDHIFYLLSRGLSLHDARRLITTGYLLPIKEYFAEKEKDIITKYVEGDFND